MRVNMLIRVSVFNNLAITRANQVVEENPPPINRLPTPPTRLRSFPINSRAPLLQTIPRVTQTRAAARVAREARIVGDVTAARYAHT